MQDKVKEKLVMIQELELQLRANSEICLSLRVEQPPSCESAKQNILMNLAPIISENEMFKLTALLNDAINCVKSYLDSCCVENGCH